MTDVVSQFWKRPAVQSMALVVAVFLIDLRVELGVASAVPYTFAVILALRSPSFSFPIFVAGLCAILTFAKLGLSPERGTTELWKVIVNRFLALFAVLMTLILGLLRRRAELRRQQAEEELREHQSVLAHLGRVSLLGQLAANMAHELNQPLTTICLQSEIGLHQLSNLSSADELKVPLQEIVQQSRRAAEIVRSVRRLARREQLRVEPVDVADSLGVVAGLLGWQINRAKIDLQTRLPPGPIPNLLGDRVQLEQVFLNLLQNAIDAVGENPPGSRIIEMELMVEPASLLVSVRDNGSGVSETERLFTPFHTTKPDGLGLGLAISRTIVESHGGQISMANRADGGAEFLVRLPIPEEEAGHE